MPMLPPTCNWSVRLRAFPTVVSLNYDLTLYWAMLLFNAANGSWFRTHSTTGSSRWIGNICGDPMGTLQEQHWFSTLTAVLRLRDYLGDETKLAVGAGAAGDLLGTITRRWASGHYVPVFVSREPANRKSPQFVRPLPDERVRRGFAQPRRAFGRMAGALTKGISTCSMPYR